MFLTPIRRDGGGSERTRLFSRSTMEVNGAECAYICSAGYCLAETMGQGKHGADKHCCCRLHSGMLAGGRITLAFKKHSLDILLAATGKGRKASLFGSNGGLPSSLLSLTYTDRGRHTPLPRAVRVRRLAQGHLCPQLGGAGV